MKELKGYIMVMVASLFWGASATAAKFLLNRQLDTLLIVQTRVTFACLLMLPFLLYTRPATLRVKPGDLWQFALLGILGVAGSNFTYYFAIKESTVATAILIQYTAPLLVMAYAAYSGEEKVTLVKSAAALVSLLGCFLAVGAYDLSLLKISPLGLVSGISSVFTFAFMNVYTRHLLSRYTLWTVLFYSIASAAAFWMIIQPPWVLAAESLPADVWVGLVVLAIVSILIPHTFYFSGLRFIVASRAIITSTLEPVVAIVTAALFLGEYLAYGQTIGALLVIGAILLLQLRREPDRVAEVGAYHAS
jgi:drug/metabolite transporter (DMT)-like permease